MNENSRNSLKIKPIPAVFPLIPHAHGAAEIAADLKEATGNGGFFRPALGKRASVWEPPPPQPRRLFSLVPRSTSLRCGPRLAVARSHSRSDMPPACHSLRSCRFATRGGEAHLGIRFCMNICLGEGFTLPSWMHARFGFPKQSLPAGEGDRSGRQSRILGAIG